MTHSFLTPRQSTVPAEGFPTTMWGVVSTAGQADSESKHLALEKMLTRYLPVLKRHLMRQFQVSEDQASDFLQSFVLKKVLEKNLLSKVDHNRGKFRTFLLHALDNFVIQQYRHGSAAKRACEEPTVSIDDAPDSSLFDESASPSCTAFDLEWSREVLGEVLLHMQRQCESSGRAEVWGVFKARILRPLFDEIPPLPYAELVNQFKLESPAQAANVLTTAKRTFARLLRSVVAEYCRSKPEVDQEMENLKAILFRV